MYDELLALLPVLGVSKMGHPIPVSDQFGLGESLHAYVSLPVVKYSP